MLERVDSVTSGDNLTSGDEMSRSGRQRRTSERKMSRQLSRSVTLDGEKEKEKKDNKPGDKLIEEEKSATGKVFTVSKLNYT